MKKEIILFMLTLLGTLSATSADGDFKSISLTCSEDSPLVKQMTSEMIEQVESLTISGTLWEEDIRTIDKCSRLSRLDLTEVTLKDSVYFFDESATVDGYVDAIGADAFCHTAVETLFLPKSIGYLDLRAVSFFAWDKDSGRPAADYGKNGYTDEPHFEKTITVYVTGYFPALFNPQSVNGYYGCPMVFKLAKGNDQYTETDGNIYTKDGKMLIKAGKMYNESLKDNSFDVQSVYTYAFTYTLWSYEHQLITFSDKLEIIYASAFAEVAVPYLSSDREEGHFGGIRFLGWEPAKVGVNFFSYHDCDPNLFPCKVVVPSKTRYIASNIWWMPYVMDEFEYGVLCGAMNPDDEEAYYSRQDRFCPRMDELYELVSKSIIRVAEISCLTFYSEFLEELGVANDSTGYLDIYLSTISSIPLSFINPKTNEKEIIEFNFRQERFKAIFTLSYYGRDGRKWEKTYRENDNIIVPGNYLEEYWETSIPFHEVAKVDDKCSVVIQLNGLKYFGLLPESYSTEGVFREAPFALNIDYIQRKADKHRYYDLQGRPVDGTQKGILIRNGKKVLVK